MSTRGVRSSATSEACVGLVSTKQIKMPQRQTDQVAQAGATKEKTQSVI